MTVTYGNIQDKPRIFLPNMLQRLFISKRFVACSGLYFVLSCDQILETVCHLGKESKGRRV